MSNATENPRNQGDQQRRRRNRGGRNRRDQDGNDSRGRRDSRDSRDSREFSPGRDARGQGPNRRSNQPSNTPPRRYAPVKLTWWQKLLKLVGLYKEPARPERRPAREATEPRVKSNTRDIRSGDSETETETETPPARARDRDRDRDSDRDGARRRPERRGGDRDSVESPRVYVGNLSYDVSESDLQDLFKGIGGVRNVEIVYNRATHRSKGYGFVEMLHVDEAKRAVEVLHDQPFMGRPLTVSGAKSKGQDEREEREDRDERPERPERRPRNNPPAAAAVAAVATEETASVTAETLGDTGEIATIVETTAAAEPETTPPVVLDLLAETPAETAEETAEETKPEQA